MVQSADDEPEDLAQQPSFNLETTNQFKSALEQFIKL